jgi:hypothetical protein
MTKPLTFRMPSPVPLNTKCSVVAGWWIRLNMNALVRLYTSYPAKDKDEFIPFAESLFVTDRGAIEPELN